MPIYEFLCRDCNRVFSFFARTPAAAHRTPTCPRCGGRQMTKRFSRFAMATRSAARPAEAGAGPPSADGEPDLSPEQEARLEREMMKLSKEMDSIDENNPRQLASLMRRLTDAAGEPLDPAAEEMIRRLEAGEDPDTIEEKMADAFPEEAGAGAYGAAPTYDDGLYDL